MIGNACFNIYILFKYPQYEDAQRLDAQSEIRDYLASHPAFARQAVMAGSDFVKSNPGSSIFMSSLCGAVSTTLPRTHFSLNRLIHSVPRSDPKGSRRLGVSAY